MKWPWNRRNEEFEQRIAVLHQRIMNLETRDSRDGLEYRKAIEARLHDFELRIIAQLRRISKLADVRVVIPDELRSFPAIGAEQFLEDDSHKSKKKTNRRVKDTSTAARKKFLKS